MSEQISAEGSCLCGKIKLTSKSMDQNFGACHCSMCRKWGGGPLLAVDCGTEVTIEGKESLGVFDSSEWAERGFCKECGSHLFYRLKQTQQYIVPVGIMNQHQQLGFDHQVFVDEKPEHYNFSNQTKNMTGAEVFAMYAPKE